MAWEGSARGGGGRRRRVPECVRVLSGSVMAGGLELGVGLGGGMLLTEASPADHQLLLMLTRVRESETL